MHWSGVVRLIAVLVGGFAAGGAHDAAHLSWVVSLPIGVAAFLLTPVLIGVAWGLRERRALARGRRRFLKTP